MQDRSPKYPGRVKLLPVSGQENIYDMTRADEPDDTGTPFNKRTMLQDSTAQFLNLPLANPFVDDALRHMVDRAVPIGTIRTSPVQSMGDAWLKCDGSTVTFENYPQLCQILRGTSGTETWSNNKFPTSYTIKYATSPVKFDGKWIVAICDDSTYVKILSASALDGTWAEEASFSANTDGGDSEKYVLLTASENFCVCAYVTYASGGTRTLHIAYRSAESQTWAASDPGITARSSAGLALIGIDHCDDRFAVAYKSTLNVTSTSKEYPVTVVWSDTPNVASSWTSAAASGDMEYANSFSCANSKWFLTSSRMVTWSGVKTLYVEVTYAEDKSDFQFENVGQYKTQQSIDVVLGFASKVVFYAGKYYFLGVTHSTSATFNGTVGYELDLFQSSNLTTWTRKTFGSAQKFNLEDCCYAAASDSMLAFAAVTGIWTTSNPSEGFSAITVQNAALRGMELDGLLAVASENNGILYHDYTYDSRLLPNISLSSDTTTFIKAKNELDVFEAGGD